MSTFKLSPNLPFFGLCTSIETPKMIEDKDYENVDLLRICDQQLQITDFYSTDTMFDTTDTESITTDDEYVICGDSLDIGKNYDKWTNLARKLAISEVCRRKAQSVVTSLISKSDMIRKLSDLKYQLTGEGIRSNEEIDDLIMDIRSRVTNSYLEKDKILDRILGNLWESEKDGHRLKTMVQRQKIEIVQYKKQISHLKSEHELKIQKLQDKIKRLEEEKLQESTIKEPPTFDDYDDCPTKQLLAFLKKCQEENNNNKKNQPTTTNTSKSLVKRSKIHSYRMTPHSACFYPRNPFESICRKRVNREDEFVKNHMIVKSVADRRKMMPMSRICLTPHPVYPLGEFLKNNPFLTDDDDDDTQKNSQMVMKLMR